MQMQEDVGEDAESAVARRVVVLVAEDRGVDLGLGRFAEDLHLLFGFGRQIGLQGAQVFLELPQQARFAVPAVSLVGLFRHRDTPPFLAAPMTLILASLCAYLFASSLLHRQKRSGITEMTRLPLGPLIEARSVHDDLAVRSQGDVGAVHWARGRALEVHSFTVISAAVAGAFEFVFSGFPVRSTAEMRTSCVDNKDAVRSTIYPDAVFLLELGVDAEGKVGRVANFKNCGWLEKSAREEKAKEGNEPRAQERCDRTPDQAAATFVGSTGFWADAGHATGRSGFGSADSRSADVLRRVRAASGG